MRVEPSLETTNVDVFHGASTSAWTDEGVTGTGDTGEADAAATGLLIDGEVLRYSFDDIGAEHRQNGSYSSGYCSGTPKLYSSRLS